MTSDPGLGVDVSAIAQQNAQDVGLVGTGGEVKRRFTAHCRRVGISAVLKQEQNDVHVPHERSHV